jgi:hypothetical protein
MSNGKDDSRTQTPRPITQVGRLLESARTLRARADQPPLDYHATRHAGQRLPFHAIPSIACYLVLILAASAATTYAVTALWGPREEVVSTHGLLPHHRLNKPVTATAVEDSVPNEHKRLLVADGSNLFIGSPVKKLRYWQWFALDAFEPLAGAIIRGLSASGGKVAVVPERGERRGLVLGTLPWMDTPKPWTKPVLDASFFPGASDETIRTVLYDRSSGDRLVGGLNLAPYDRVARHWKEPLLLVDATGASSQINELTALDDATIAALGASGIDTLRWSEGKWRLVNHAGLRGTIPRVALFGPADGQRQPGTGELTYLTEKLGLGHIRLRNGIMQDPRVRIAEGRAEGITRAGLTRALAGAGRESAWMLYRADPKNETQRVAHYRFSPHQMIGLPAGQSIPVGSDPVIALDPTEPDRAWIGGHGLFTVHAKPDSALEAVDALLTSGRIEEIAPTRDTIFASTRAEDARGGPVAIRATPRSEALMGGNSAWLPYIGSRRLDNPLTLKDITAAAEGTFGEHDSIMFGTRKDGLVVFDRESRELFSAFRDDASASVVAPGTQDLHMRERSIVQVGSDRTVNLYDGKWRRVLAPSATDLVPARIRKVFSDGSDLVLTDGQLFARYLAKSHEWKALPRLEASRMELALGFLWAVGPKGALYKLSLTDPQKWQLVDNIIDRVDDLYADANMIAVIGPFGQTVRVGLMMANAKDFDVVFESNESSGDSTEWRTFALHDNLLFVAPHAGKIGRYDAQTHGWTSIDLPVGGSAARELAATDRGLWLVDERARAWFRPEGSNEWESVQQAAQPSPGVSTPALRKIGANLALRASDGGVLISDDGAPPLRTIVGRRLSAAPDKISTGVWFKGSLIVASDSGIHRYDPEKHDWDNAPRPDPIIELAHSADKLYARTKAGAVLLWSSNSVGEWEPVKDANGNPLQAEHLAGSEGSFVAAVPREGGVAVLSATEPARAKPLLLGSRLSAAGAVTAATEIGQELVLGTANGAVSSYAKPGNAPRVWKNNLTNATQTGPVRAFLVPPGRTDRLVVVSAPGGDTRRLLVLDRDAAGGWGTPQAVVRDMKVADAAVDGDALYASDTREDVPVPLVRIDLSNRQEKAVIGAAFPKGPSTAGSLTRAVGVAPLDSAVLWRADEAGRVAGYDLIRHAWEPTAEITQVDRFFSAGGKLWSWSRGNRELAVNDGKTWRPDTRWQEVANDGSRLVLLGRDGKVVVRDQSGNERAISGLPDKPASLPPSSPAEIDAIGEHQGHLFISTPKGPLIVYDGEAHEWCQALSDERRAWCRIPSGLRNVRQFASTQDSSALFAITQDGALWSLDGSASWKAVELPDSDGPEDRVIESFREHEGHLIVIAKSGEQIELFPQLRRLSEPVEVSDVPNVATSWRLDKTNGARLLRAVPKAACAHTEGGLVEVSLSAEGFGFDRVWAVGSAADEVRLYTEDGLVRLAGADDYVNLPNLDCTFARPNGLKGTAEIVELAKDGTHETWARADRLWRYDGKAWQTGSPEDLLRALSRLQPMVWDDGTTSWSRDDGLALKLSGSTIELSFRTSTGRFDADTPFAIAADGEGLAALTPRGIVRYGPDFSWRSISWPLAGTPSDARAAKLLTSAGSILLESSQGTFRWSGGSWVRLAGPELEAVALASKFLIDGKLWRIARREGSPDINIEMRPREDDSFIAVRIVDGRFDFETVRDVSVIASSIWAGTQFGLIELDPAAQEIGKLLKTERPVSRFATFLDGTVGAQLEGGDVRVYRSSQWQTGGSSEDFTQANRRVVQEGPWSWLRSPGGPKVQLNRDAATSFWRGGKTLDVRFSSGRFAFDDVRDAAFADRPWLATAAGLLGRSGSDWSEIELTVQGQVSDGTDWSGIFAVAGQETSPVLICLIDGEIRTPVGGEWRAPPDAAIDRALLRDQGAVNANYLVRRAGPRVDARIRLPDDPSNHYVPAVFDRNLRRFRHDKPTRLTRDPSRDDLLVATEAGIFSLDSIRHLPVRLYADAASDGIGIEPIKELVYLPNAKRTLANGRFRLDAGARRWVQAGAEDTELRNKLQRVPYDDPNGWRIELVDASPRLSWRGQPAILFQESAGPAQPGGATRFAHDVVQSAFLDDDAIVMGTRGGIVRFPLTGKGLADAADFSLTATDVLTPEELAQRAVPRGIGFLRPGSNDSAVYAVREADGQALRLSASGVRTVAAGDAGLRGSQEVARDGAWNWSKSSSAAVQMRPEAQVFHVPAGYNFLNGRTWLFLDTDQTNRQFPHRAMVPFQDDLFVATAGGVSRFSGSDGGLNFSLGQSFMIAVYAQARNGRGTQPMLDVVELHVSQDGDLIARTRGDEYFVFDPQRDDWERRDLKSKFAAELFHVSDSSSSNSPLDWSFDESGVQNIVVSPLKGDLKDQSSYPLFVNGRFAFDEVRAILHNGAELWLATAGGICIYDRSDFTPRAFFARAFLDAGRTKAGDADSAVAIRELVRDPDRSDRIVARMDRNVVLATSAGPASFQPVAEVKTDELDVFERAYTRESPSRDGHAIRLVQYPFNSYRFPNGAVRARLRDSSGNWVELGRSGEEEPEVKLPLFSKERFAFDDVSDGVLYGGRLLLTTPVGVLTHRVDWEKERAIIETLDVDDGTGVPGLPALHDMVAILAMPSGAVMAWNNDRVFRMERDGVRTVWRKDREQADHPVTREQILSERDPIDSKIVEWRISVDADGVPGALITRISDGHEAGQLHLGSALGDVSRPVTDDEWIYLPRASVGLLQVQKEKIR